VRNPVSTRKLKVDGSAKAPWNGDLVDTDGDWLIVYYEAPGHRTSDGRPVAHALRYFSLAAPLSILVCFDEKGAVLEYQCDAALPATLRGRDIEFVDLDLDLMVGPDGSYHVRDQEAFAINSFVMGYSPEAVQAAHDGIDLALALVERREPPFDGSAGRILGRVLAASGPL
jgi:protein associated with RNAse G/E